MNTTFNDKQQNANGSTSLHSAAVTHKKIIRRILFLLAILVSFSCGALFKSYASAQDGVSSSAAIIVEETKTVDVVKGDTLLKIAREYAPKDANIYSYVEKIKKLNGLKNASLYEGQILELP